MGYPQLDERQVRHLLGTCELRLGTRLDTVRGKLLSNNPIPAIWELLVLDAFADVAQVEGYEESSQSGRTPDIAVQFSRGEAAWVEVACIQDESELAHDNLRKFFLAVRKELQKRGFPHGATSWDGHGWYTDRGQEVKWPLPHEHRTIIRSATFKELLARLSQNPSEPAVLDLRPDGYTLSVRYEVPGKDRYVTGHGGPIRSPRTVEAHPLYLTLGRKYKLAKAVGRERPLIVVICGEGVSPLGRHRGPNEPRKESVLQKVFSECPEVAAVIIVYASSVMQVFVHSSTMEVRTEVYVNASAVFPLGLKARAAIKALRFDRYEIRPWSEWGPKRGPVERAKSLGGQLIMRSDSEHRPVVEVPAQYVQLLLSGEMTAKELAEGYGWDERDPSRVNPFKRFLKAHMAIERVSFVETDPHRHDPPRIAFHFGPAQPPVLAVPKQNRNLG